MKRFMLTVGLAVAVLLLWHSGPVFAASPRIALVIGNGGYAEAPLANPVNDAKLMAKTLRELGFVVIERTEADQKSIQLAIFELQDRLFEAGKDAVGLFFYAGHGVQVGGQNYLIPMRANIKKERDIAINAVSANFILGQMEAADNRMNFVILDACRNNPLTRSFRSAARGLARMDAPKGSLIAYSTGPGEVAADGMGGNSPYTLALEQAMQTPDIPAEQMFKLVRDGVMNATGGEQTPWEESSLTGADFYFNGGVSATVETSAIPSTGVGSSQADSEATERLFWQSINDSDDPASFEAYLDEYSNGKFAALARLRIKKLMAITEEQTAALLPLPETEPESQTLPSEEKQTAAFVPSDGNLPDDDELLRDREFLRALKEHYNSLGLYFQGSDMGPGPGQKQLDSIENVNIISFARNNITAKVRFRWHVPYTAVGGVKTGEYVVAKIGSAYQVINATGLD